MAGEWRELPFSEAVLINPPVRLERGKKYPFVDMGALNPGARSAFATQEREFSGGGSRFEHGDTLMARITPCLENGKIARFCALQGSGVGHGSTEFIVIRGRPGVTHTDFAYYLTLWEGVRGYAISHMTGTSGRQRVPTDCLQHLTVPIPPLPEQCAIAHILGTLDDKIELNRQMSETLEAMARALFKAWFVDFEPVRAKMEGRWQRGQSLPGLPAHLYDLFPDRLVDSELGEIPEGWEVGTLGQVLGELVSGARPKGGAAQEGVPSIGAENVIGLGRYDFSKEKYVPRDFFKELQRKGAAVRPGDVLLYKDGAQIGRKTYFDCGFPHEQCAVNEHVFIVRARHAHYQRYLFFWLDQDWMTQEIISLNSNSAQPGINQQGVRALPLLKPPDAVVEAFDRLSKKLTDRLFTACHESRTLAALRDALLPKLISGETRVKDAERFLKERGL
jgi:type I restriction enzyme S subunit